MPENLDDAKVVISATEPWSWFAKILPECQGLTLASNNELLLAAVPGIMAEINKIACDPTGVIVMQVDGSS